MTGQQELGETGTPAKKTRRGTWTAQQRRRAVADSQVSGASIQDVAQRHGIRANLLSAWRAKEPVPQARSRVVNFAAVKIKPIPTEGIIEIDLMNRCVRVRGVVNGVMLREVLAAAR